MNDISSFVVPSVSRHSLVLGLSYSLTPEGAPGSYNEKIAQSILEFLSQITDAKAYPEIAIQWEIRDAMEGKYQGPEPFVVGPPHFTEDDFGDGDDTARAKAAEEFIQILKKGETAGACALAHSVRELLIRNGYPYDSMDPCKIFDLAALNHKSVPIYLNQMLDDPTFYLKFRGNVELHDLYRSELGLIGVEKREMPAGKGDLLPYQARRVNRLIIEAICPDPRILQRSTYLSTQGVLDKVLANIKAKGHETKYVFIFAHPVHSLRCKKQTMEALRKGNFAIPLNQIYAVHEEEQWEWDPSTAQAWCRNAENWRDYENMGIRRL